MDYEQLKQALQTELPINRKERFYTGTVLPSILFHKGLSNLFRFLKEIKGFPADINESNTRDNFLFYTEYNLKESAGKKSIGAEIETARGDTPDAIIEILEPQKVFVVIEAKMFANLTQNAFSNQVAVQKKTISDVLKKKYNLDDGSIFHIGLTPRKHGFKSTGGYQIITWEFLLENEEINLDGNYFANFLRFALENYDKLLSEQSGIASTVQDMMTGFDIYMKEKNGESMWVGRQGGSAVIQDDVKKGTWKYSQRYSINSQKPSRGRPGNWISSREFAEIVDGCVGDSENL